MNEIRQVRLYRDGDEQAVHIPPEFELPGDTATMRREGDRLVIEPPQKTGLLELLASWEPIEEAFPDIDDNLPPLDDIEL